MTMTSNFSPYTDVSQSSKSPLYGLPASVAHVLDMEMRLPRIIEQVSKEFQDKIRADARQSWGEVANSIFVVYDKGEQALRVFSTHPDANLLEYGDTETPPQPVLRQAAYAAQASFAERVSSLLASKS